LQWVEDPIPSLARRKPGCNAPRDVEGKHCTRMGAASRDRGDTVANGAGSSIRGW
jgi:hypothetical protein